MLTKADIKPLKRAFGNSFRNFTDEEWRQFKALLQQRSKGPDDSDVSKRPLGVFSVAIMKMKQWETDLGLPPASNLRDDALRMLVVAANYFWKNRANPTPAGDSRRQLEQLEKVIKNYRRDRERLSKLALDYVEELFLTGVIIDSLEKKRRDLQNARFYKGAAFNQRQLVFNLILIWVAYGGKAGHSRNPLSRQVGGPLIRYLTFAWNLIVGQDARAAGTFRDYIRDFNKETSDSKMWNPALLRPRKKK
jgi:hypothetical protein